MNSPKITTIIATYNAEKWIVNCLSSLETSTLETSIIIVDNYSTDRTIEIIETKFPNITLIQNFRNLGFGQANNIGIKTALESNSEYILLLNQDAWVLPNTLKSLLECSIEHPEALVISPLHKNSKANDLESGFKSYLNEKELELIAEDKDISTNFINAAVWLLPSKAFKIIGGFNPTFFHYGEDYNFCERIVFHGYKVLITPSATAYHERKFKKSKISEPYQPTIVDSLIFCSNPNDSLTDEQIIKHEVALLKHAMVQLFYFRFRSSFLTFIVLQKLIRQMSFCKKNRTLSRLSNEYVFLKVL